jgi:hypothetical protein
MGQFILLALKLMRMVLKEEEWDSRVFLKLMPWWCPLSPCCLSYILIALFVRLSVEVPKWAAPSVGPRFCHKANVVSVCLSQTFVDCGQGSGMKERLSVRPSSFLSFFLSFCLCVHLTVSLSVHSSFFPSLTSPSSLAPFSVSLIYIFLVSFSGSHVIGLFSMCSNVHQPIWRIFHGK